jgi:tripartite motif-containing protein 71
MPTSGNRRMLSLFLVFLLLVGSVAVALGLGTTAASGDEGSGSGEPLAPTAAQTKEALESGNAAPILAEPETDLQAAQRMPHRDLDRNEALELAEAVFQSELEGPGGIYDELEPEKFLSDNAAVVPVSALPGGSGQSEGTLASEHPNVPVLVESVLPLRTENSSGEEEAVDLQLEHSEGELQSQNPLAEVGIPEQLGEGITMGGAEVEITVAEAPESRTATNAGGEFAFYPEVSDDSDLIVTPTPQGLETMVDLRSSDAPTETTYELALPPAAELRASDQGGAEVVEGAHATVVIPPPTAVDAAGNPVETELAVSAESITVIAKPTPSSAFPILVDPVFIEEGWRWTLNHDSIWAWTPSSTSWSALTPFASEAWWPADQYPGLDLSSGRQGGWSYPGDHADWQYWVPRYLTDLQGSPKEAPSTWVYQMYVEGPQFYEWGNTENYPALVVGLVDPNKGWQGNFGVHYGGNGDLNSWSQPYWYTNPTEQTGTKGADMDLVTYAEVRPSKLRDTYMPDAYVSVVDGDAPLIDSLSPPEHWMNTAPEPIPFQFEDHGLGVYAASLAYEGAALPGAIVPGGALNSSCAGTVFNPCPRIAKSGKAGPGELQTQLINYSPAGLPTGKDPVTVRAFDPLAVYSGHVAAGTVVLKIDHAAPEVSLSGTLTEQGSLGARRPTYSLRVNAKDGIAGVPQSGVKKVEVKVDGATVPMSEPAEWEPNCQTENCSVSDEWTLNSSAYAAGPHEVQVIATDAVDNPTTKTIQIELSHPAPTLALSGTLTEQGTLGGELPSYKLQLAASALSESPPAAGLPTYSSSFGTSGTGNGQFAHPGDVALGNEGNLFVVDTNNNRIEKFNGAGGFVKAFGTKGAEAGQLERPTAIAVAANGNLWVTNAGEKNKRVEEFTPEGAYVTRFGEGGTGAGKFAGSGPEGIAIDYHGNIWVSDTFGGRLEKFSEAGKFIRSVGVKGTGYEQLGLPTAVEVAPGGQVYVTDWEDDKVAEYGEGGGFIRQFGSQGNEPGQLQQPTGIAIDSLGDIWVGDQNNQRIEEFNLAGEYLRRFGAEGTGAGQFKLQYPIGIATDSVGDVWVTDPLNNRVEKWVSAGYANPTGPTFLRSFGAAGKGAGQFEVPCGMASDGKGDVWVADLLGARVEKLTETGTQLLQLGTGTAGSANTQFNEPCAIATDGKGHVFVGDVLNNRVQEFSETGTFIRSFAGSGTNALLEPLGVAVDSKGNVWVSDFGHGRLEEFSEAGVFIKTIVTKGSGAGHLVSPRGIAVTATGQIWVVDEGGNRLEEFSENGALIKEVGGEGSGAGRFHQPCDLAIDASGNLWVTDDLNQRVVELSSSGEFIRQFGSAGTGTEQFQTPVGLALDGTGHAFISDYSVHKIDEWNLPAAHSQISTEVTVDGRRVDAGEASCTAGTCPLSRTWTLEPSKFTVGSHVVTARATDGLGNTATKTLNVKVGDTTKPALEVGGELISAPEGWVQQGEGSYSLTATATDKGFGVTKLAFTIDGAAVASKEQACAAGKCSASISTSVNVKALAAGAHEAEVATIDGAGNASQRKWTINVNPEGVITNGELTATAEAMEETSGSPILAAAEEIPGVEGSTSGVGLTEGEEPGALRATGTYVPMKVSGEAGEGFELHVAGLSALAVACDEVENPEEEECVPRAALEEAQAAEEQQIAEGLKYPGMIPITVKPVATGPAATEQELLGENTAGSANAGEEWDTFTRPVSDGGLSFADIRGSAAPEHYAYQMDLSPELRLQQSDPQHIEVVYWKYGVTAFVITAEQAHDVIGSTVPTHLSISGPEKITLTVEHRGPSPAGGGFVYPVMGGAGWQGGYYAVAFEMNEPLPPAESEEEEEELEEEGVVVDTSGEFVSVDIMGFGPQHVAYSGGSYPTPHSGWAAYIARECDWFPHEVEAGTGKNPTQPPAGGKYQGVSKAILDELIYHCHRQPNNQGGYLTPGYAVTVRGTYSWVYGEEAKIRTTPKCLVAGAFPPVEAGCGGPRGEVRAGGKNPKVSAYNRVWFKEGTYRGPLPWCAVLEITLPSEPRLDGKHALQSWEYWHWYKHPQNYHETAGQCPWEHF